MLVGGNAVTGRRDVHARAELKEKTPEPLSLVVAQVPWADAAPPVLRRHGQRVVGRGTTRGDRTGVQHLAGRGRQLVVVDPGGVGGLRVTLVAVLPPSGPTAALVYSLVPSFDETTMVMP